MGLARMWLKLNIDNSHQVSIDFLTVGIPRFWSLITINFLKSLPAFYGLIQCVNNLWQCLHLFFQLNKAHGISLFFTILFHSFFLELSDVQTCACIHPHLQNFSYNAHVHMHEIFCTMLLWCLQDKNIKFNKLELGCINHNEQWLKTQTILYELEAVFTDIITLRHWTSASCTILSNFLKKSLTQTACNCQKKIQPKQKLAT